MRVNEEAETTATTDYLHDFRTHVDLASSISQPSTACCHPLPHINEHQSMQASISKTHQIIAHWRKRTSHVRGIQLIQAFWRRSFGDSLFIHHTKLDARPFENLLPGLQQRTTRMNNDRNDRVANHNSPQASRKGRFAVGAEANQTLHCDPQRI